MKLFLAHKKYPEEEQARGEQEIARFRQEVIEALSGREDLVLVNARTFFEERFKAAGSWNAWCKEIATGTDYLTREPYFDGVVVPEGETFPRFAAGTGKIVECCLEAQKPCLLLMGGRLIPIASVKNIDPEDFFTGWEVTL